MKCSGASTVLAVQRPCRMAPPHSSFHTLWMPGDHLHTFCMYNYCDAGTWADINCAVSGTGVGEEFIRRAAAHDVAARMEYKGLSLAAAMHEVVWQSMAEGDGGFVGVDRDYNCVMDLNSVGMYRAAVDYRGNCVLAVFPDEVQQEEKQDGKQQEKQEGHGK